MNKNRIRVLSVALVICFIFVVIILLPRDDICSDDIRGYERIASSSLSAVRTKYSSIKAAVEVGESLEVTQLEGLNSTNFPALSACNTHCKLLNQCLRFAFFRPPSQACPIEYTDYKEATKSALVFLAKLHELELSTERASQGVNQLVHAKKAIEELENSSGSTGGRLAILNARAQGLESELSQNLFVISQKLDSVVSQHME